MPIFLKENEIGFDTTTVGFPGLGSCMGLVLQTPHGLFGFHAYGSNNNKGPTFETYARAHGSYGPPTHLFGSSRWANRYSGSGNKFLSWLEEMNFVADQLHYKGRVSGFDISNTASGVPTVAGEAAYLQYDRDPLTGAVAVRYAKQDDVDAPTVIDSTTTVLVVRPDLTTAAPYRHKVVRDAQPRPGSALSTVGDDGYYSFVRS